MTTTEPAADLHTVDRYARLWSTRLPIAAAVDATTVRLVWLTVGFSVPADRAPVGDYVCGLDIVEFARRAHLGEAEGAALECCPGDGYRLHLERPRTKNLAPSRSGR